jgi:hypothetical protein
VALMTPARTKAGLAPARPAHTSCSQEAGVDRFQAPASAQVEAAMLGMRLPSLTRSALSSSRSDYPNFAPTKSP